MATCTAGMTVQHKPVLLDEAIDLLQVEEGGTYVDCTVGLGGHAERILEKLRGTGLLIGLDRDREALSLAGQRLRDRFSNFNLFNENFKNLSLLAEGLGLREIDGCLVDLGVSSLQLDSEERGFSFRTDGPLDMRMDRRNSTTAAQLVNRLPEEELARLLRDLGEEKQHRKIAAAIVRRRQQSEIRTTGELANIVASAKGAKSRSRIHPATQVFQALRIEVNQELEGLEQFLTEIICFLKPGGRLVVISFHSLEDRIVKRTFRLESGHCICFRPGDMCSCPRQQHIQILTPKPLSPGPAEIAVNPRARSAKLRAIEKIGSTSGLEHQERKHH